MVQKSNHSLSHELGSERCQRTSERCQRTRERPSEWLRTYVSILVCSRPQGGGVVGGSRGGGGGGAIVSIAEETVKGVGEEELGEEVTEAAERTPARNGINGMNGGVDGTKQNGDAYDKKKVRWIC